LLGLLKIFRGIMKKLLLTAVSISALLASSVQANAVENTFYLKANAGWSKLDEYEFEPVKFKSENVIHVGVGAGYHVMKNARVDLVFDHFINPTFKTSIGNSTLKFKGAINTLLLNGYFDVYSADAMRVFIGAGVGASQISAKTGGFVTNLKTKQKYTMAFAGYAGLGYEFSQGVVAELSYGYRHMGKTVDFEGGAKGVEFKGHHVTAGVRFDI
jgi:opacity protein-like surface antigen